MDALADFADRHPADWDFLLMNASARDGREELRRERGMEQRRRRKPNFTEDQNVTTAAAADVDAAAAADVLTEN